MEKIVEICCGSLEDALISQKAGADRIELNSAMHLGVKRVLTSGLKPKAVEGVDLLAKLQNKYGDKIEILAGSGVNASNCTYLINETGISQYHSSCKSWRTDLTTISNVSFAYAEAPHEKDYDIVSYDEIIKFVKAVKER